MNDGYDDRYDRWSGLAIAGGVLMLILGGFRAVSGFIGLFNDEWIVRGFTGYYFVDVSALSWWMLIIGVIVVLAGLGVLAGQTWARIVGVITLGLAAVSEFFWMPVYPLWSIMMLVTYAMIIIALIAWKPVKN